jgi:hypothetical protein
LPGGCTRGRIRLRRKNLLSVAFKINIAAIKNRTVISLAAAGDILFAQS